METTNLPLEIGMLGSGPDRTSIQITEINEDGTCTCKVFTKAGGFYDGPPYFNVKASSIKKRRRKRPLKWEPLDEAKLRASKEAEKPVLPDEVKAGKGGMKAQNAVEERKAAFIDPRLD